jgi:hypothetical protein
MAGSGGKYVALAEFGSVSSTALTRGRKYRGVFCFGEEIGLKLGGDRILLR